MGPSRGRAFLAALRRAGAKPELLHAAGEIRVFWMTRSKNRPARLWISLCG